MTSVNKRPAHLHFSSNLTLPLDAVTQTFVIFGKRGSGKTNSAVVLAEEMFPIAPFVVLDPIGAWWGLKSSFDGAGPGLGVYVFGGPHGDLPLDPSAGNLMADLFIEHRIAIVLDMTGWSGAERTRFVTAFALRLLAKNGRVPVHVFLEESDAFAPQRPYKGEEAMLGAVDRLVRWGRQEGIGATLITQRSARVNKDVTTQAETLIAHRTTGPQDRDAIDAWIRFHAGGEERQEVLATLPTLPSGTAWVWSPEWLDILQRVPVRRRQTYDSASTPKVGEKRPEPRRLAEVDVERLRSRLATTIEKVKVDDPRELRRRIVELERQLVQESQRVARTEIQVQERQVPVEVKVLPPDMPRWVEVLREQGRALQQLGTDIAGAMADGQAVAVVAKEPRGATKRPEEPRRRAAADEDTLAAGRPGRAAHAGAVALPSRAQQKVLDVLARLESVRLSPANRTQVAFLSGYTPNSGGFNNYLGALRSAGLIDYPAVGKVTLTDAGRSIAAAPDTPPTTEDLHAALFGKLGGSRARVLRALIDAYPGHLSREEVAERSGFQPNSGGFNNYLGSLRSLRLIEYPGRGRVVAEPVLFLGDG